MASQIMKKKACINIRDLLLNQLDMPNPIPNEALFDTSDPLEQLKSVASKTYLVSVSSQSQLHNDCINIAIIVIPIEGRQSRSALNDEFCEELCLFCPFPTGKCGYKVKREIKLRPVKEIRNLQVIQVIFFESNGLQNLNMQA